MDVYDSYTDIVAAHPDFVQKLEAHRQKKIIVEMKKFMPERSLPKVLEIGVGTGLFAELSQTENWSYIGIDRSKKICDLLSPNYKIFHGEVPPFPEQLSSHMFDIIYAAFVLEHMKDGVAAHHFLSELCHHISPDGLFVLVVPDSISLGMEFWNIDYTHTFPTTKRNVTQILGDCGMEPILVQTYRGPYITGLARQLLRFISLFYSYEMMGTLFGHKAFFYSVFQYIKQDVLMFVAKRKNKTSDL